jgi:transposase InsO family protein
MRTALASPRKVGSSHRFLFKRPQSNGIVERFHCTALDEHFRVEGRSTWFETINEMQIVLYDWLVTYNFKSPHRGSTNGRTPIQAFKQGLANHAQKEVTGKTKLIAA